MPHNLARHTLSYPQIVYPKAAALAAQINELRPPAADPQAAALLCNVLTPEGHAVELERSLKEAAIVIDASASIAAARFLSDYDCKARRISAFFNPAGEAVVVLAEPADRSLSLRDLEAQYYRAVLRRPELERHLSATGERFAYTGACRALTNRIPQSRAALLSSLGAAAIGHALGVSGAVSGVWTLSPDGAVVVTQCDIAPVTQYDMHGWAVTVDENLTQEIHALRLQGLPAETGGILLGVVDAFSHSIHVVEALPAPPDSIGEEGGFERGLAGLEEAIRAAMARTMDQVRYVGEWHSHPREYSISPSYIDLKQMAWLASTLAMENRLAVMLIAGDHDINVLAGQILQ